MFSLFRRKKKDDDAYKNLPLPQTTDWSVLGADMHSHFLPGIDDGAKTIEDTIQLLKAMYDMGYRRIITSPHIMIDHHPNTRQTIEAALSLAQAAIKEHNIDLKLTAAAEYYIDDYFVELLEREPLLTVRKKEVLVEFSMMFEPPMLKDVLFNMQRKGYRPIIAHPERYLFFHRDISKFQELKDRGCMLQMNMLSITGYYGGHIKAIADQLMAKGLYDYCGTDMHHEKHASIIKAMGTTHDYHKIASYPFLNSRLMEDN